MDQNLVYAKTPTGEDAIRQRTRVVQRNLRLVLILVDGKTTVAELAAKVDNASLVDDALRELEEGGFIAPVLQAPSVWEQGKTVVQGLKAAAISQFSTFGPKSVQPQPVEPENSNVSEISALSAFSDFGDPLLPPEIPEEVPAKPPVGERLAAVFAPKERAVDEMPPLRRVRPLSAVRLLFGLLVLLCAGAVFYPYNNFKPDIEAALGKTLQAPVRIGNVALGLLPRPALMLQNVDIGAQGEAHIDEIRIQSLLSLSGSGRHMIPAVDIAGLSMPVDGLALFSLGRDSAPQDSGFTLGHARLQRMVLRMNDVALRSLEGEMFFKTDGKLEKAVLQTDDRTLQIEAAPAAKGMVLNVEGYGWKPMDGAPYVFEAMQAKGLLQPGRLVLHDIDTTFLGGTLKGSWLLDWNKGMAMAGEASLARLSARRVAETFAPLLKIEGELSGTLRLRGSGKDWQALLANVDASLDADIARGVLTGIDLGEAARRGGGRSTHGGATKFDRLRGVIVINPQQVVGRDIRLEAGLISANGRFTANRERKVEGLFDVSISSSVSGVRMPIKISGTLPDLAVAAGR